MQLKRRLLMVISIIIIVGIIGKMYMDHQNVKEQKAEEQKLEAERMSVVALKETFADIKSLEFEGTGYTTMTGYYDMNVKMTSKSENSVNFDYSFSTNHPSEIAAWSVVDEEKVQIPGKTKSKVEVTYSDGSKEDI